MISVSDPDYENTPASDKRPGFAYIPREAETLRDMTPFVSIITPYYNTGPVFMETVACIKRMSYPYWEWIIVDDGSTDQQSLERLAAVQAGDDRVKVIRQTNSGPSVARNLAAREARGKYLLQLDSDDMVEPTFVEKALWVMEAQPQFAACSAYNVTFGANQLLWDHGFHEHVLNLTKENYLTSQAMICRDAYLSVGGYDESIVRGHEDWDFWLNLADGGYWGYTIPEYLTWYRNLPVSRRMETSSDKLLHANFHRWLLNKHKDLLDNFPRPVFDTGKQTPHAIVHHAFPIINPLAKKPGARRVLFVVPWVSIGGADKFNLDLVRTLSRHGCEFTIVTTCASDNPWVHEFAQVTPDIFMLPNFLRYADHPRFLNYLIESRQIDTVLISNSELGYLYTPYLRAYHPNLPILDYIHVEEEEWNNGGYPWMSVRMESQLDLSVTSTHHLKKWMIRRGATPEHIQTVHTNIDPEEWNPKRYDVSAARKQLGIDADTAIILFVGRVVDQKRPLLWAEIMRQVAKTEINFIGLVVGEGNLLDSMKSFVKRHKLTKQIRFLGALPNKDVRELMAASDILLLPSKYEGLALVLYEALTMQMVPVATNFGGHPELVTLECGYLIGSSATEVEEYVTALRQLLRNREQLTQMAQAGYQRVREHFTLERMADGMEAAFAQAAVVSAARATTSIDLGLANSIASSAIEYARLNDLADRLWLELQQRPSGAARIRSPGDAVRLARARLLPIGTQRYEIYKRIRRALLPFANYVDDEPPGFQTPTNVLTHRVASVKQTLLPMEEKSDAQLALETPTGDRHVVEVAAPLSYGALSTGQSQQVDTADK